MSPSCGQQPKQSHTRPLWLDALLSSTDLQVWDARSIVFTLWLPLVLTSSGEWAQPEASRNGRGPAAQTEGEAALLRGGLPARRGRLPVFGPPLHPRLQETWVVWLVGLFLWVLPLLHSLSYCLSLQPQSAASRPWRSMWTCWTRWSLWMFQIRRRWMSSSAPEATRVCWPRRCQVWGSRWQTDGPISAWLTRSCWFMLLSPVV